MRWRRLPVAGALVAAGLLLAMNVVPDVHSELETFPTPGSGYAGFYSGYRDFGWPATYRTDRFSVRASLDARRSPLEHLFRSDEIQVHETEHSVRALLTNAVFAAAAVVLIAVVVKAASNRRFSLRILLAVVTSLGVILGSFAYARSLSQLITQFRF